MGLPNYSDDLHEALTHLGRDSPLARQLAIKYEWVGHGAGTDGTCYRHYVTDKQWGWLGFGREPGKLLCKVDSWTAKAAEARIGRAIRAILAIDATDAEVEEIANKLKAWQEGECGEWRLLAGDLVAWAYGLEPRSDDDDGGGGETTIRSCMQGEDEERFALYRDNPEKVKLLAFFRDNVMTARALVWWADDGEVYVDRAYGSDSMRHAVAAEAAKRGWHKKRTDSYTAGDQFEWLTPDGSAIHRRIVVTLPSIRHRQYPYMDTFKYLRLGAKTLSNDYPYDHYLVCTEGYRNLRDAECRDCGCAIDVTRDEGEEHDGAFFCDDCAAVPRCPHCDEWTGQEHEYCDGCRRRYLCTECGEERDIVQRRADGYGYCAGCLVRHLCRHCARVVEDIAEGACGGCRRRLCRRCGAFPTGPTLTLWALSNGDQWYEHQVHRWDRDDRSPGSVHLVTVCIKCERSRLMTAVRRGIERQRQERITAGQLALA